MKKIIFSPAAVLDADCARVWYEEREAGLGREFINLLEECISRIQKNPMAYPVVLGTYRKLLMKRFPYHVIYEERADSIWILAVYHVSRRPKGWRHRKI